jgi:uncharacterized protein
MEQMIFIGQFVWHSFLQLWPYLLITIPLAVAVNISGASRYINRAFQASPLVAILLATIVGAFSPFCSCTVIPVVASLLIGGVPLAPVMAFWIASPSMDPEIFFLSVGFLGWELALWRFGGTLLLSLAAGLLTHLLMVRGWLGQSILRQAEATAVSCATGCCGDGADNSCNVAQKVATREQQLSLPQPNSSRSNKLWRETWSATRMVAQFMALAFLLEALIVLFVPQAWIVGLLGSQNQGAIPLAALLGVPVYTSNLTALPLIGALLEQGMSPAAALAFLIAGPTTTLPAMAAVWGLVQRRIFVLYATIALLGALLLGMMYLLLGG